jgi:hypothetical protein
MKSYSLISKISESESEQRVARMLMWPVILATTPSSSMLKPNFAKRGTPIQSQNSHDGSSLIVVLKKSSAGQQHSDTAHPLALLRPRRKRPRSRRAAEQRDELASS